MARVRCAAGVVRATVNPVPDYSLTMPRTLSTPRRSPYRKGAPKLDAAHKRSVELAIGCSPIERAYLQHFAAELGVSLSSYMVMAAIRYGMHLPRAVPLSTAMRLGTVRARAQVDRLDDRLLAEVNKTLTNQGRKVPVTELISNQDKLDAMLAGLAPPVAQAPDPGEDASAYDFSREVQAVKPEDESPEGWQTLLDNLSRGT